MISDFLTPRQATGSSQWRPYAPPTNALTSMAAPSNPVADAYTSMFGRSDDGFDGFGDGVSGGVSSGVSPGSKGSVSYGRASGFNNNIGSIAGKVGTAVGSLTGIGGVGTVAGLAGTGYDLNQVDQNLAAAQTPGLSIGQVAGSLANSVLGFGWNTPNELQDINIQDYWGPAGFDPMASYGYANFDPFGAMGFADPIGGGEDGFGGWGSYGAPANTGPGADIEGEPGNWSDLEAAANEAAAAAASSDNADKDDFGGWGGYGGSQNDGPGADAEGDGW